MSGAWAQVTTFDEYYLDALYSVEEIAHDFKAVWADFIKCYAGEIKNIRVYDIAATGRGPRE